jgi:predicted 3-demethylubiquinone-9 3-methyltransferase (glyoxalase superfamily)
VIIHFTDPWWHEFFVWLLRKAREAAEFYVSVFPDSQVGEGHASVADNPSAKAGEELTVEFIILGQAFIGLNGGPNSKPNEAVSFMILTENQVANLAPGVTLTCRRQLGN